MKIVFKDGVEAYGDSILIKVDKNRGVWDENLGLYLYPVKDVRDYFTEVPFTHLFLVQDAKVSHIYPVDNINYIEP